MTVSGRSRAHVIEPEKMWDYTLDETGADPTPRNDNTRLVVATDDMTQLARAMRDMSHEVAILREGRTERWEDSDFRFNGLPEEDPREYLRRAEEYIGRNKVPPRLYDRVIRTTLAEGAYQWYKREPIPGNVDWAVFRFRFLHEYDSASVRANLKKRLYGEPQNPQQSVAVFIGNKVALFQRVEPEATEEEQVALIIELITWELRAYARLKEFRSTRELTQTLTLIEQDIREKQPVGRGLTQGAVPRNNPRGAGPPARTGPPSACRFCGGQHFHRDCPTRAVQAGNETRTATATEPRSTSLIDM